MFKMAKVGGEDLTSHSNRGHNAHRALLRQFSKSSKLPNVYQIKGVFWNFTRAAQYNDVMNILLPSEVLNCLLGDNADLDKFVSLDGRPELAEVKEEYCSRMSMGPSGDVACLSLWGDSAPFGSQNSVALILFNILSGSVRQRFWIASFTKRMMCQCGCSGRHTLQPIMQCIAWDLKWLMLGKWPSRRHDDIKFKDSHFENDGERAGRVGNKSMRLRACLVRVRGDWEWFKNAFCLRGWKEDVNGHVCFLCSCKANELQLFTSTALWRHRPYESIGTLMATERFRQSPLLNLPGFILSYAMPDFMHTSCLGYVQYLLGNVFWEVWRSYGGTLNHSVEACARILWLMNLVAAQNDLEQPITNLTLGLFKQESKPPKLRLKAAHGRYVLHVWMHMLNEALPHDTRHDEMRRLCVFHLQMCYNEIKAWLPEESPPVLRTRGSQSLILYGELSREAILAGDIWAIFWRCYPKMHLMAHCLEETVDNPAESWNYEDESNIGLASEISENLYANTLHRSLIPRFRILPENCLKDQET